MFKMESWIFPFIFLMISIEKSCNFHQFGYEIDSFAFTSRPKCGAIFLQVRPYSFSDPFKLQMARLFLSRFGPQRAL